MKKLQRHPVQVFCKAIELVAVIHTVMLGATGD
jgi:hypothetical protein